MRKELIDRARAVAAEIAAAGKPSSVPTLLLGLCDSLELATSRRESAEKHLARHVVAVGIRRFGAENDPKAEVIVAVQYSDGTYEEIGRERVGTNFSSWWKIKES